MGVIPSLKLPSNQKISLQLRNATVQDLIDLSDADPSCEEAVTTLFLSRLQDAGQKIDPLTMTADDRRLAVFWYWLHTTDDPEVPYTYECGHCGKEHTFLQDMREVAAEYRDIEGKPRRELLFDDTALVVQPLSGADMERLESLYSQLDELEPGTPAHRKMTAELKLARFELSISVAEAKEDDRNSGSRFIRALNSGRFAAFVDAVNEKLAEMNHGLNTVYDEGEIKLITPPHRCPEIKDREVSTRLRVTFRNSDYVPQLF